MSMPPSLNSQKGYRWMGNISLSSFTNEFEKPNTETKHMAILVYKANYTTFLKHPLSFILNRILMNL